MEPRVLSPTLLNELSDEPRPPRLMTRAEPRARVAVEVLMERDVAIPVGIALKDVDVAEDGTPAVFVLEKDP